MKVSIDKGCFPVERAHPTDAGVDIKSPVCVTVPARGSVMIDSGVHVQLRNAVGLLMPKSGLMKAGILSFGVIDEGYSGGIAVKLFNHGDKDYKVMRGDKITQLIEVPVRYGCIEIVESVESGERGGNGFGSTGR